MVNLDSLVLEVTDLRRSWPGEDGQAVRVVDVPSLTLNAGEAAVLTGPSGAGKTTLLHVLAGLLAADADSGPVRIGGRDLRSLSESQRDRHRAAWIGCVFQSFRLLPGLTVLENVVLGQAFGPPPAGPFPPETLATRLATLGPRDRALHLLERVGLADYAYRWPRQLSVGQRQRVAVARALVALPRLVLADEPAASLDPVRAREVVALLHQLCSETQAALLVVAHDPVATAAFARRLAWADLNRAP